MIHVATMDSDIYIRYGLPSYFNAAQICVFPAASLDELTLQLRENKIDMVVMELFSRDDDIFDCIEYIRLFRLRWPDCKLIIYTQIKHQDAVDLLFSVTGAQNIIAKKGSVQQLSSCLFSAVNLLPDLELPDGINGMGSLTLREWGVIRMLNSGMTQQKIATRLCISNKTVSQHINNIEVKFGVKNRLRLLNKLIAIKRNVHKLPARLNT